MDGPLRKFTPLEHRHHHDDCAIHLKDALSTPLQFSNVINDDDAVVFQIEAVEFGLYINTSSIIHIIPTFLLFANGTFGPATSK